MTWLPAAFELSAVHGLAAVQEIAAVQELAAVQGPAAIQSPGSVALSLHGGADLAELVADAFLVAAALFLVLALAMFYRAVRGPTMQDRVLAVNVLGTNTVVVLALLAAGLGEESLLDVALVYALLNFLMAVAISKFTVDRGGVI